MLKVIKNFCSETNLHGFIYIVQPTRHKFERAFWIIIIATSFILTGILIFKLIKENQVNPVVIFADQNVIDIQNINFPSVSFCPGILFTTMNVPFEYEKIKERLKRNSSEIENLSQNDIKMMQIASLVAKDQFMSSLFPNLSIPTDDFVERMKDFGGFFGELDRTGLHYYFNGNYSDKHPMNLTQTLSKTGFCYTFNFPKSSEIFNMESISNDFNYTNITMLGTTFPIKVPEYTAKLEYPLKAQNPGRGLFIGYMEAQHLKNRFISKFLGFSVPEKKFDGLALTFHDPYEVISNDATVLYVRKTSFSKISVVPKISNIDESLINFTPEERQCFLNEEHQLKFFKIYNRVNCEHECLANLTLEACGCVQFFMLRNSDTRICGITDEKCFQAVEDDFENKKKDCYCLELCRLLKYEFKLIFDWSRNEDYFWRMGREFRDTEIKIESGVSTITATSKRQRHKLVDMFSLFGGFLGLFAGFSFLSGVEILQHFLIDPLIRCMALRKKRSTRVQPFQNIKIKVKSERKMMKYFLRFLENSSIHSFNHMGNVNKSTNQRFNWLIFFFISMALSFYMIRQAYLKLKSNEVVISLEGRPTNVKDIPFPAFTLVADINDYNGFEDSEDNYAVVKENGEKHGKRQKREFDDYIVDVDQQVYGVLCEKGFFKMTLTHVPFNFTATSDFVDFLRNETQQERPWFIYRDAKWEGVIDPPFAEILTNQGFGYTFNLIDKSDLLKETKISRDFLYDYDAYYKFPWSTSSRSNKAFEIKFKMNKLKEGCYDHDIFFIHSPNELPISNDFVRIEHLAATDVLIEAEIVKINDNMKDLSVGVRKCYLDNERNLKYFKKYTQKNCEQECLTEIIYIDCGCVPFYAVRNSSVPVCAYSSNSLCALKYYGLIDFRKYKHLYESQGICNCLPSCNYISYSYEAFTKSFRTNQNTSISLMWKNDEYYASIKYRQFDVVEFLSYIGGILGLFAGISVLSIVECIYFFTLRLMTNISGHFH